jgi:hypothetical protein
MIRPSGVSAFDAAVVGSIQDASPFPPAPHGIASPDGLVHLRWTFHRDPLRACMPAPAAPP